MHVVTQKNPTCIRCVASDEEVTPEDDRKHFREMLNKTFLLTDCPFQDGGEHLVSLQSHQWKSVRPGPFVETINQWSTFSLKHVLLFTSEVM